MNNGNKNRFWEFRNTIVGEAELILYGDISSEESWWRDVVTPKTFAKELSELGNLSRITVRIFSSGGGSLCGCRHIQPVEGQSGKDSHQGGWFGSFRSYGDLYGGR